MSRGQVVVAREKRVQACARAARMMLPKMNPAVLTMSPQRKMLRRSRIHISPKRCADHRPSSGRDNDADSSGHTPSEVVLVLSGVVDGIADRLGDAVTVVVQPALGALALKFAPGRDGEPLEEDVGLSDAVIQPPAVAACP